MHQTYREMQSRVEAFFTDPTTESCTFWDCAYSAKGKENLAFWEYKEFNDAYAKAYIKKNSKRFIKRLLDEGDEKRAVDSENGLRFQSHIKNTASDSKRKRADDSTVIHLGADELKRNRKRKSLSVTQIAAGESLLLLFFCCAKILHIANENKKREEQKKWTKTNA